MSDAIRVLVVDDHELFRRGVIETLHAAGDFAIEAEASTARDAIRLARLHLPELILLDLGLPDGSGLDAVAEIHRACPVSRIVVLTVNADEDALLRALREGAAGYMLKGVGADELVRALRAVVAGEGYVSPTMATRLLRELGEVREADPLAALSEREREVLTGIAAGRTNREIATELHLTEKTVKYYVTNVLVKLQVRNRVEAALKAQRLL
jgi:DNA-binding NarL/FixJ family response regulator